MARCTLIVGDIRLYREGLAQILRDQPYIDLVGTASDPESAIRKVTDLLPQVVLLDTAMPKALQTARRIRAIAPEASIIALGVSEDKTEICACAEAGVSGFVAREASLDRLLEMIAKTSKGELRCSPSVAAYLLEHVGSLAERNARKRTTDCLTRRQSHILDLVSRGRSNKEIARHLGIEVATVKNHVHQILERLQMCRRGEAAALWLQERRSAISDPSAIHLD